MIISAHNFTLSDLRDETRKRDSIANKVSDGSNFVKLMIELKDDDVRFSAVYARMIL